MNKNDISIEKLANTFRVSYLSTAIRIAEVSPESCLALLWQPKPKNRPRGLRLAWRTGRGISPRNKVNYLPYSQSRKKVNDLVDRSSSFYRAYETDVTTKSVKDFKVNDKVRRLPVESNGFGYGDKRYVISLAFLDR